MKRMRVCLAAMILLAFVFLCLTGCSGKMKESPSTSAPTQTSTKSVEATTASSATTYQSGENDSEDTDHDDDSGRTDDDKDTDDGKDNDGGKDNDASYTVDQAQADLLTYLDNDSMSAVYVKTVTVNGGEVDFYQFDVRQNNGVNTSHVDYYYVNIPGRGEGIYNSQKMYEMFGLDES